MEKEMVMFYNVENLFSPDPRPKHKLDPTISGFRNWDERKYQNKLHKIASVFKLVEEQEGVLPMIIGLAEVYEEKNLKDLISLEPFSENFGFIHYDSLDERGVDTALLYDKKKIEVLHSEPLSFIFEEQNNDSQEFFDTTRDILYCKLKYSEELINIFVVHLPSKREKDINKPKRDFILKKLKDNLEKLYQNKENMIICGDFNENPDEENLKMLLHSKEASGMLLNPFLDLYQNKVYSTYHNNDGLLFDQILLSNNFFQTSSAFVYTDAEVFCPERISSWDKKLKGKPFRTYAGTRYLGGYSDHFPVLVKLKINYV